MDLIIIFLSIVQLIKQSISRSTHDVPYHFNKLSCIKSCDISPVFSVSNVSVQEVYTPATPNIVVVLAYLFNLRIDNSIFPGFLKLSKVVPLFKKGVRTEYTDYRPLSIIPAMPSSLKYY